MYYDTDFVTFLVNVTVIEENKSVNSFEILRLIFGEFHRIQVSTVLTHIDIPTQQRLCRTVRMAYAPGSGGRMYIAFQYKCSIISLLSYLFIWESLFHTLMPGPRSCNEALKSRPPLSSGWANSQAHWASGMSHAPGWSCLSKVVMKNKRIRRFTFKYIL